MGSFLEINDTLQITKEQGFPSELNLNEHLKNPITLDLVKGRVFEFKNKKDVRFYQIPPIRIFLVENINNKWLYWGHCNVIEVTQNTVEKTTSGKFVITKIFTLEEMKQAYELIDAREGFNYLK